MQWILSTGWNFKYKSSCIRDGGWRGDRGGGWRGRGGDGGGRGRGGGGRGRGGGGRGGGGRGGIPPGLRGREIGMYFAKKSREKQKRERTEAHLPKDKLHYLERELEKALSAQVNMFLINESISSNTFSDHFYANKFFLGKIWVFRFKTKN